MMLRLLSEERNRVVTYARRLRPDGLVVLTYGNISERNGDRIAITPTGVDYDELDASGVPVIDLEGKIVEGALAPSTEWPLHSAIYRDVDCRAIVHTHSPFGTVLSTLVEEIPPIHYIVALLGGPVPVSPYRPPGSRALAAVCAGALHNRQALLMQNHGSLTVGRTLAQAYERAIALEWLAALYYRTRLLGEPRILSDGEMAEASALMANYGTPHPLDDT